MTHVKVQLRKEMSSRFRSTRQQLDISQEKMAELLDISPRAYNDLENGKSLCSTVVFLHYLQISKTNVTELLAELETILTPE